MIPNLKKPSGKPFNKMEKFSSLQNKVNEIKEQQNTSNPPKLNSSSVPTLKAPTTLKPPIGAPGFNKASHIAQSNTTTQISEKPKTETTEKQDTKKTTTEKQDTKKTTTEKQDTKKTTTKKATGKKEMTNEESTIKTYAEDKKVNDYAKAAALLAPQYILDNNWEAFTQNIDETIENIKIDPNITLRQYISLLAQIDELREHLRKPFAEAKSFYEILSFQKPEGLIERTKRLNCEGKNEDERNKNAILACMNYNKDGEIINLYTVLDSARIRYNYFMQVDNRLSYLQRSLYSVGEALKSEAYATNNAE